MNEDIVLYHLDVRSDKSDIVGEMEALPFDDNSFDVVCGFNSFQYAANTKNALTEQMH